jgi:hypothetical protein
LLAGPRGAMVAALCDGIKAAVAVGDLEAARVGWVAVGRMLASARCGSCPK